MDAQSEIVNALRNSLIWVGVVFISLLLSAVGPLHAEEEQGPYSRGSLLINNVTITDRLAVDEDVVVNILIRDNQLRLVTQDTIAVDNVELALDAQEGVLLGTLSLGEPATFLILVGDPREDFDLLLATERHTSFAIKDGVILRNRLLRATDTGTTPKRPRWLGYNPPRVVLPTSIEDPTKWNRWDSKAISGMFTGVLALDRLWWVSQSATSKLQVGNLDPFEGGELRALEAGFVGTLNFKRPWVYTIFAADNAFDAGYDTTRDSEVTLRDFRLDIPIHGNITLGVGKQKEPISMERIMSLIRLPWQERSAAADAMLPSRNVGLILSGTGFKQRLTWAGGVFNDWLDDQGSMSRNSNQFIGRLTWLPFLSDDEGQLLHLGVGARYSDAEEGIQYLTEAEFNQSPVYVDTGLLAANHTMTYDLEAYWHGGPFWIGGEYIHTVVSAPELQDPSFKGYHVTASWLISGENRGYNRRAGLFKPILVAKSVRQDGWGAWETAVRWSTVDLTDQSVQGGEMDVLSLGLTWWLTSFSNVSANYRHIDLDRFGLVGTSSGLNLRLVLLMD